MGGRRHGAPLRQRGRDALRAHNVLSSAKNSPRRTANATRTRGPTILSATHLELHQVGLVRLVQREARLEVLRHDRVLQAGHEHGIDTELIRLARLRHLRRLGSLLEHLIPGLLPLLGALGLAEVRILELAWGMRGGGRVSGGAEAVARTMGPPGVACVPTGPLPACRPARRALGLATA